MAQPIEVIAVSVPEAASLLGIGRTHFYQLARTDPKFPTILKFGKSSRILLAELREWAQSRAVRDSKQAFPPTMKVGKPSRVLLAKSRKFVQSQAAQESKHSAEGEDDDADDADHRKLNGKVPRTK